MSHVDIQSLYVLAVFDSPRTYLNSCKVRNGVRTHGTVDFSTKRSHEISRISPRRFVKHSSTCSSNGISRRRIEDSFKPFRRRAPSGLRVKVLPCSRSFLRSFFPPCTFRSPCPVFGRAFHVKNAAAWIFTPRYRFVRRFHAVHDFKTRKKISKKIDANKEKNAGNIISTTALVRMILRLKCLETFLDGKKYKKIAVSNVEVCSPCNESLDY